MKYGYIKTETWPVFELREYAPDVAPDFFVELSDEEYRQYLYICDQFYRLHDRLNELAEKNRKS